MPIEQPLKWLDLTERIVSTLDEVKLNFDHFGQENVHLMVCSLIATIILNCDRKTRLEISRKMINEISTLDRYADTDALNTANILKFIAARDIDNRKQIRGSIESVRMQRASSFRTTLYKDILLAMER